MNMIIALDILQKLPVRKEVNPKDVGLSEKQVDYLMRKGELYITKDGMVVRL